jgi:glycosyltransferase involved in cell wall biosynthesis
MTLTRGNIPDHIDCSVIIPTYNEGKNIGKTLVALFNQKTSCIYEIIVVDSSHDNTPEIIKQRFPEVKLIHLEQQTPQAEARNIGIKDSKGRYILFLDGDCEVDHDWIERMVSLLASGNDAVGGPVRNGNPESWISWAGYLAEFSEFFPKNKQMFVGHLPTCNISYKREILDKYASGGFEKFLYAQEDLLFNWKLQKKGIKILFHPEIAVSHHHRTTIKAYLRHQYYIGRGTVQVLQMTDLQGSGLIRHRFLVILISPFLPLVKFTRSSLRFLRWRPHFLLTKPIIFPLFALGLVFWLMGFLRQIYTNEYGRKGQ